MPRLSGHTGFGDITLSEEDGALVSLDWGWAPLGQQETVLLLEGWRQLRRYFDGDPSPFTVPLEPPGTDFQRRVWHQLQTLPFGAVATYGAVAAALSSGPRILN